MCKEDVRIKRQTDSKSVTVGGSFGVWGEALAANAARCAVTLGFAVNSNPSGAKGYWVGSRMGSATVPIVGIASEYPVAVVTVEQVGVLITGQLFVTTIDGAPANVTVTEVFFTKDLKDL